jgi:AAA ATPase domain
VYSFGSRIEGPRTEYPARMPDSWPLVGRDADLVTLRKLVASGTSAVLLGPAGIGKSRVLREVCDRNPAWVVLRVRGTRAAATVPLGAFGAMLPPLPAAGNLLGQAAEAILAEANRLSATARRCVLAVDDAHLLDPASAALVYHLALHPRLAVVATVRSGESVPDAISALWTDEDAVRVELAPLDDCHVVGLAEAMLGGRVDQATARLLAELSQGLPLLVQELVHSGRSAGRLVADHGVWRWRGGVPVTAALSELIDARVGAVDAEGGLVLATVAFAEPVELSLVEHVVSPDAVEAMEARGLIRLEADGLRAIVRMTHPLHAEAVRHRTPRTTYRRIARVLADLVEGYGCRRRTDLLRTCVWRVESGTAASPERLLAAYALARAAHDLDLAERLARAAYALRSDASTATALASVLNQTEQWADAEQLTRSLWALAGDAISHSELVRVRAFTINYGLDRPAEADQLLIEATERVGSQDSLDCQRYCLWLDRGRCEEASAGAQSLLDRSSDPVVAGTAAAVVAACLGGFRHMERHAPQHGSTAGLGGSVCCRVRRRTQALRGCRGANGASVGSSAASGPATARPSLARCRATMARTCRERAGGARRPGAAVRAGALL